MKKRILLFGLIGTVLFAGCGSSSLDMSTVDYATADVTSSYSMEEAKEAAVDDAEIEGASGEENVEVSAEQTKKKLIVTENINVETTEFDTFLDTVNQKVEDLGGYIESSEVSGTIEYGNQYADLRIRIPEKKLDEFITSVDENGTVVYDSKTTEDVTLQYVDTESHLNAIKVEEETLLSMLEKAESLTDILEIQGRLTELRYQIENYESQLRVYDNQVDYSTVNLTISEVSRETAPVKQGFWSEAVAEFGDSLYFVGQALRGFAIWFIGSIPVFLVLAVIITIIVWIVKRHRKRKMARQKMGLNMQQQVSNTQQAKEDQMK